MTVSEAISKGHKRIKNPIIKFFIIVNGIMLYASYHFKIPVLFFLVLPIILIVCAIWWSIAITKWRIWAFGNCRNVHELKRRAINEKLIGSDGGIFQKIEFRTKKQKEQLKIINQKFEIEDTFKEIKDDKSIERETKIYFSKIILAINSSAVIMLLGFGLHFVNKGINVVGYFFILVALSIGYYLYVKHKDNKPYIAMNSKGIKTLKTPFISWENIEYIRTKRKGIGRNEQWYLEF